MFDDALLFLFVPFARRKKALGHVTWNALWRLLWVGQSTGAELYLLYRSGGGCKHWWSLASPVQIPRVLAAPRGLLQFPAFSTQSLSLICCSEAVYSALSCLSGVIIALSMRVYLSLLMGEDEFHVFLYCHHLVLAFLSL